MSLLRWIFSRNEDLDQVVFYFLSSTNFTSARYFPFFDQNNKVRIVYIKGLPIRYTDFFMLKLFKLLGKIFKYRFNSYTYVHVFNPNEFYKSHFQVLHIDDLEYEIGYISMIIQWEQALITKGKIPIVVCTNPYTEAWLKQFLQRTKIIIIEQGFYPINNDPNNRKHNHFCCVYSSPYIHYGRDKHSNHSTWGSNHLLDEIIPRINALDSEVFIHLIGEIGPDAKNRVLSLSNVICHGQVSFIENAKLLNQCDIAIYPRTYDHKRSILKIFSYIGAGLPIVTYDLIDTQIVKSESLGFSVKSIDEFIYSIAELKTNVKLLNFYSNRVQSIGSIYHWSSLANKLNNELRNFIN